MNVLYLEDSVPDIRLVQQYMGAMHHQFIPAQTIPEAFEYLQTRRPDVFLVDIVIGKEMAYDLIVKAAEQGLSRYIVAVTAKALPSERRHCLELGCDRVLAKPFTVDDLERTLNQLVQE